MPGSVVQFEFERRQKEILRLYLDERLPVSEIARLVGISRSRVYAYLERINASRPITVDVYLAEIIHNSLQILANLSEQFLRDTELPDGKRPTLSQRRGEVMLFGLLFDRVTRFLADYYRNSPPALSPSVLPSLESSGPWEDGID